MTHKIYPESSYDGKTIVNFVPQNSGAIERIGYSHFFGLVWSLIRANKSCLRNDCKIELRFTLPLRWW